MYVETRTWEGTLLNLAREGWLAAKAIEIKPIDDKDLLKEAYAHSEGITSVHSRSFHMASALLPTEKREAARALYAFCRITDDIVDCQEDGIETSLRQWQQNAFSPNPPTNDLPAVAWADTRSRYQIPVRYAEQLLEGVSRDLHQTRYESFDDLATYCYGVASTVGLMSMHIIGFSSQEALPYAIKLGIALQLTNILRDVGEDFRRGRVYLPQEELDAFDLTENDLAAGVVDDRWRRFMRFQISRNRQMYAEAWTGIEMLNKDGRFAIAAAADLYRAILNDIEENDYDVFNRRAHITTWGKLRRLPGLWWRTRKDK